ncbi:hypothetical protein [Streptomyces sp. NPDC048361]|uniref:hypothetical protein n=1 Tax=Streptomyces sp. NPDC048361 TaxID=3154720 RepID=UPI003413575E
MPRNHKRLRRLVADGYTYLWRHCHSHRLENGRPTDCRQILTLYPQHPQPPQHPRRLRPVDGRGPLRIVFADGPGRYVPGGAYSGSGDVGHMEGADLNLHEPGAVRALLDAASARGWHPGVRGVTEVDGWTLLEAAAGGSRAEGP